MLCHICSKETEGTRAWKKYCSMECKAKAHPNPVDDLGYLSSGTKGALKEVLVCADMLRKKVLPFRAISAHGPCDLIGLHHNGTLSRIEVTTGRFGKAGQILSPKDHHAKTWDVLAVVLNDGRIFYTPEGWHRA